MSKILMTMAEDATATSATTFGLRYPVDEYDCLHFAESLKQLGHEVYFVNWLDLRGKQFTRMFSYNTATYVTPVLLQHFDLFFVYKMEGFYERLEQFHAMIDEFARHASVINDVRTIKHNLDKSYLWELESLGIATIPSYKVAEIRERLQQGEKFVIKPLHGERGKGIYLAQNPFDLVRIKSVENQYFAQKFMETIRDGERSLVFLGHEFQHAVIKHPSAKDPNEFRCNESLGGTVAIYDPTQLEINFAHSVLRAYEALGYPCHFSRIDLLQTKEGPVLLEAELLNPSIYANYSGKGVEFGNKIAAYFDRFIQTMQKSISI